MGTLDHPAVAVAVAALTAADPDPRPVAAIVRGETVAVLVFCERGRIVMFVQLRDGQWVVPSMNIGGSRLDGPRAAHTPDHMPLHRMGTSQGEEWFAVTGLAALDAVSVSVHSTLEESVTPIGTDGLAFAVVRARRTEDPDVYVHTADGRRVSATLRMAG